MDKKRILGKIAKIITIVFSITLTISLILEFQLTSIPQNNSDPSYLLIRDSFIFSGRATLALLFPFLLSIAYGMAVTAKHTLEKGIQRLRDTEELKCPIAEDTPTWSPKKQPTAKTSA